MSPTQNSPYPVRGYEGFDGVVNERASESIPSWPKQRRAKPDAPNVILMLLDDMGFSDISPFGAEIDTPTLAEIAAEGYRLNNYQTPPMCAPARAAILTGLNPHRAGFAFVPHMDPGFPNTAMELPEDAPTLAENFRAGGYATFMVGKWHLTVESRMHDGAPKDSWPIQRGFDRYYGCMDGFTSLFHPHRLVQDNSQVVVDDYPEDFYLTDDLTDRALGMLKALRASDPIKPFFLYFSHQAVHAPLQAKAADIEKYRGRYESGWDHIRSERFARQISSGLFPEGTRCAPRNTEPGMEVVPWESLSHEQKDLFARYMEVYAAMIDNVDQNLKRITDHLKETGEYENTIVVFTSDNGGAAGGGIGGTRSYFSGFGARNPAMPPEWTNDVPRDPELIGGPQAYVHYPHGWAYASNTPFRLYKSHTYAGGVRVPMLLSWPAGLPRTASDDGLRTQYAYATDLGATLMKLAGIEPLTDCKGRPALETDGLSFAEWLRNPVLPTRHTEQYVELGGRRSFMDGRWKAIEPHPNGAVGGEDAWELYDVEADPTELHDLASDYPERVRQLAEGWKAAAWYNQVFPLNDDHSMMRNRPSTELFFEEPVTLYPGTPTLERYRSNKLIRMRSFSINIRLDHRDGKEGVLVAHGDQGGGYCLYVEAEALHVSYNQYGEMKRTSLAISEGQQDIQMQFQTTPDFKWEIDVKVAGQQVRLGPVLQLTGGMCPFTGISVGLDRGGPVDWELHQRHGSFPYNGLLSSVRYTPGAKAAYNREQIIDLEQELAKVYD
ncbi:arylsulfatase [Arthrobacter sp. NtRootA1]|uniref:arylsulfatase n=1 Tax=Arthrobacter sp. NtRootA1 TaxID=2830983 RepID=UPI001CC6BA85|nr:arylsulfatase [Arthrobacter sp. NtRootA1]BCW05934.1 arylsulfatase [Arthrobacter sp. NtRootA1]